MAQASDYSFSVLEVQREGDGVLHVKLNRPDKLNAMNAAFWREVRECFEQVSRDSGVLAVVVSGNGRVFTAGLDLTSAVPPVEGWGKKDAGRKAIALRSHIESWQATFTAIWKCRVPVIVAVHGACIGGGIDMITACDIRYATQDAWFSVKEVDVGLAADVGTLQRLPKVVGNHGLVREWVYTGRKISSAEALEAGLVSKLFPSKEAVVAGALKLARTIAAKSPVAIAGAKDSLTYSMDHTVDEGLTHIAMMNSALLQSGDMQKAAIATLKKQQPTFSKL